MKAPILALVAMAIIQGCGSGEGGTAAPAPTGPPRKEWSQMTKEEKIETINKQSMPEQAKKDMLDKINRGLE